MPTPKDPPAPAITGPVFLLETFVFNTPAARRVSFGTVYMADVNTTPAKTIAPLLVPAFQANVMTTLLVALPADSYVSSIVARCLSDNTVPTYAVPFGPSFVGLHAGGSLPLYVTAVASNTAAGRGRHFRGRCYYPCLPRDSTTDLQNPEFLNTAGYNRLAALTIKRFQPLALPGVSMKMAIATRPPPATYVVTLAAPVTGVLLQPIVYRQSPRAFSRKKAPTP